jgi:hypothetical protein
MNILRLQNNNKIKHRNSAPKNKELDLHAEVNEKKKEQKLKKIKNKSTRLVIVFIILNLFKLNYYVSN